MSEKTTAIPDSDESARKVHNEDDDVETGSTTEGGQTSMKSGKHSSVEKLAASRPESGSSPGNTPVDGASGSGHEAAHHHSESGSHRDKALKPK